MCDHVKLCTACRQFILTSIQNLGGNLAFVAKHFQKCQQFLLVISYCERLMIIQCAQKQISTIDKHLCA